MNNDGNTLMQTLSLEQKNTLVYTIAEGSGLTLDYHGFLGILLGMLEDVPGFDINKPKVGLLNEMWLIYEGLKRHKYFVFTRNKLSIWMNNNESPPVF